MQKASYTNLLNNSPIPIYSFHVRSDDRKSVFKRDAILDTGADFTLCSMELISLLNAPVFGKRKSIPIRLLGNKFQSPPYRLSISLDGITFVIIKVYYCPEPMSTPLLIGRNYLNRYLIEFDGPKKTVRIHD